VELKVKNSWIFLSILFSANDGGNGHLKKYTGLRYRFTQPLLIFPVSKIVTTLFLLHQTKTYMKKISLFIVAFAFVATTAFSQALRKTEKINDDQVPVAILEAFQHDFGKIPDNGYWTANVEIERDGSRSVVKPLSYAFHKKEKGEKIEVRYLPDGKLESVKGLEKTAG
jgi:hypothetical protein